MLKLKIKKILNIFAGLKLCIKFAPALPQAGLQNDPWCNGSTPVFGIVSQGSSPCGSTYKIRNTLLIK